MIEKNTFEYNNERAVLVALITPSQNETKAREYLSELAFLAETAGAEAVKSFLQRVENANPRTFVAIMWKRMTSTLLSSTMT